MKTIGLLGGMSWESTVSYYQLINQGINKELGGFHSAKIILNSIDFAEIEALQHQGEWDKTAAILAKAAQSIQNAGADFILICTNTMHKVASAVESDIDIPLVHIADATGQALVENQVKNVGLLGTKFTMEQDFYKQRLSDQFNLSVLIPEADERDDVHHIIYNELCQGKIKETSKQRYLDIINNLQEKGAEAIILGCTEITLLVKQTDTTTPLYDTTQLHAQCAIDLAIKTQN